MRGNMKKIALLILLSINSLNFSAAKNTPSDILSDMKECRYNLPIELKLEKAEKSLKKLAGDDFFCEGDALKAAENWIADFPSVLFEKVDLKTIKKREVGKRGRPLKNEKIKDIL